MPAPNTLVQQAIKAFKAGQKDQARTLLMQVVDQDEHHEQGWLWLSAVAESLEEQQICLENVLAINPGNERARKGLDTVNQKLAARGSAPSPASAPSSPSPFDAGAPGSGASSAPIGAEFASASGDSLLGGDPAPATAGSSFGFETPDPQSESDIFGGWFDTGDSAPTAPTSDSPASSVEWGRDDAPAVFGSGKQVDPPSGEVLDNWVDSLGINGEAGSSDEAASSPFPADNAAPFGDTSIMFDGGFGADSGGAGEGSSAFGSDLFGSETTPWGSETDSSAFGSGGFTADAPLDDASPFGSDALGSSSAPFGEALADDHFTLDDPGPDLDEPADAMFTFDDEEPAAFDQPAFEPPSTASGVAMFDFDADDDDFSDGLFDDVESSFSLDSSSSELAQYAQYIPADIEAAAGGGSALKLLGVVLLLALNAASIGHLITSL
ncbi:MAG: hypothetical protein GYB65_09875 [Chloroflexi bacterium]|nr:hypothetical protein [Chloroflexota bacterium]